jgi:hypothetical protein
MDVLERSLGMIKGYVFLFYFVIAGYKKLNNRTRGNLQFSNVNDPLKG